MLKRLKKFPVLFILVVKMVIYSKEQYYEAILQIRPYDKKVIDFALGQIDKRDGVFISKVVELKTGVDFYTNSQQFTKALANLLKRKFKGTIKISRTLYSVSRLTSRKLYRLTVCFRLKE